MERWYIVRPMQFVVLWRCLHKLFPQGASRRTAVMETSGIVKTLRNADVESPDKCNFNAVAGWICQISTSEGALVWIAICASKSFFVYKCQCAVRACYNICVLSNINNYASTRQRKLNVACYTLDCKWIRNLCSIFILVHFETWKCGASFSNALYLRQCDLDM